MVLAVGHSARDVYQMLFSHNVALVPKDFAVSGIFHFSLLSLLIRVCLIRRL